MKDYGSYNLIDERWIPVLMTNGEVKRLGIKDALIQAGKIRQIAASNPMDRVAIIRFLLALLYWCKGNPPSDSELTKLKSFPEDWFTKLDENKEYFNLLGDGKRFYQYRKVGDRPITANYLIHEIPTGRNAWHFRHSTEGVDGLCPACCALGLLRLPLFSTSGGRGKPPGINSKPPIYVIPVGESLAATLLLSWLPVSNLGTAAWEQPDIQLPKTGEVPLLRGLTWLPRRVWLGNLRESEAKCISCGRIERLILSSVFAAIGSTRTDENSPGRIWSDPHVIYEQSNKGEVISLHAGDALGSADSAAGQWTRIIAGVLRKNHRIRFWAVGFSTVQNDKYLEAIECIVPFLPSDQINETLENLGMWQKQGKGLAQNLFANVKLTNEKTGSRKHKEIQPMVAAIRPQVEGKVSAKAGDLLARGDEAWQQAAKEYRPMMNVIASSLSPGFTTAAVKRRRQIANTLPDMRRKEEADKKPGRKKGGDK